MRQQPIEGEYPVELNGSGIQDGRSVTGEGKSRKGSDEDGGCSVPDCERLGVF